MGRKRELYMLVMSARRGALGWPVGSRGGVLRGRGQEGGVLDRLQAPSTPVRHHHLIVSQVVRHHHLIVSQVVRQCDDGVSQLVRHHHLIVSQVVRHHHLIVSQVVIQ